MKTKLRMGIAANLRKHPHLPYGFDPRGVREVEETRLITKTLTAARYVPTVVYRPKKGALNGKN